MTNRSGRSMSTSCVSPTFGEKRSISAARAREEFEMDLELRTYPEDEFVDFAALRDE